MRIAALDLIRFMAALLVVFYHYIARANPDTYPLLGNIAKYGYLGVPIFFIISGYVIALSANHRSALQFGVSRIIRLYPALWISVIFTASIATIFSDKHYTLSQILANFTLINEYLGFDDIDGVYWTLKAEIKFYACIFLLLLCGAFHKYRIWLSIWLGLTIAHTVCGQPFFMGWFITPAYSSFFIAGVVFSLLKKDKNSIFNLFILAGSLIISCIRAYGQTNEFMLSPNVIEKNIAVGIICLFYCLMYFLSTGKINLKERRLLTTLGALTYPLYLIHNVAGRAIIKYYSGAIPDKILIMAVVILMILISWIIHVIAEKPLAALLTKITTTKILSKVSRKSNEHPSA